MRRIVITGYGAVSVLGSTKDSIADSLYYGKCGIVLDAQRRERGFLSALTGHIRDFSSPHLSRKQKKTMPLFVQQSFEALRMAIEEARLGQEERKSLRCGLVFGNDSSIEAGFALYKQYERVERTSELGSHHLFSVMNSTVTMNLGVLFGIQGGCWTVSGACASGLLAVGQGFDAISMGRSDIMLCGAAQEISPEAVCAFDGLGAFSKCEIPEKASRPFDARRDGLVPSGGAAAVVLEEREHALKRHAPIYGEILGFGYSSDGASLIQPNGTGLARAITMAIEGGKCSPGDITEINAHATSTVIGDAMEAKALQMVFGSSIPPVLALKSLTGHEFWMSGASQIVYGLIMAEKRFLAGAPSFESGDTDTMCLNVLKKTVDRAPETMLCEAAGFGGCNAALLLSFP